ncbi:hypothetical protein [Natronincola ferrireducens]|uniref:Uncharacterized protein n=1 Tax=Natronincola ferrireducens TaxID=393762 RepID=A0A1G8XBE0_9FIRM|nr:hypothetical protein [Natronincola ferrireducens]SDJ87948.1 hypothetical protein SAMN05660472_00174 [Natronincola ferrireducens]
MSNTLMIIGLLGMVAGVISPVFRVLNKKPRRSAGWVVTIILSFLIFILGVVLGME